ncbi:MAG TPA: hypothetical protein VNY80_08020 [Steroidobacteraceae bacterium]|jgi:hypothetical protein|nr:hypothetical protein [Steroidobacteraceae bacterium]
MAADEIVIALTVGAIAVFGIAVIVLVAIWLPPFLRRIWEHDDDEE